MKYIFYAFLAISVTVQIVDCHKLNFFLGKKNLKDSMLEGMEIFQNLMFDIVEDGLQKNPKAYEMLKGPFQEIKINIKANMKAIHTFAIETSFWTIKNFAEYGQAMWSKHGKDILSGKFDHDRAYHGIMNFLKETEQFFAVQGLGLSPKVENNLD